MVLHHMIYTYHLIEHAPAKIGVFTPTFTELDIDFDGQLQSIKNNLEKKNPWKIIVLSSQYKLKGDDAGRRI